MGTASYTGDAPARVERDAALTLADLQADARHRLAAAVLALPVGLGIAVLAAWTATVSAPVLRPRMLVLAAAVEVGVVVPRGLRVWRLRRVRRHDRRASGPPEPVRVAVHAAQPFAALPAVVVVWPAHDPDGPPRRVDAADWSAAALVDRGRLWATVVGGPHRLATYRLDDATPVVAAGRTNALQRWLARAHVRDLRRRGLPLDRRADAPYPRPRRAGSWSLEVATALGPMALLAVGVGLVAAVLALGLPPPWAS